MLVHKKKAAGDRPTTCSTFHHGAQVDEVDEHQFGRAVVVFEFEAYPEPKILSSAELQALHARYKSFYKVGDAIGASEGFARQNAGVRRRKAKLD